MPPSHASINKASNSSATSIEFELWPKSVLEGQILGSSRLYWWVHRPSIMSMVYGESISYLRSWLVDACHFADHILATLRVYATVHTQVLVQRFWWTCSPFLCPQVYGWVHYAPWTLDFKVVGRKFCQLFFFPSLKGGGFFFVTFARVIFFLKISKKIFTWRQGWFPPVLMARVIFFSTKIPTPARKSNGASLMTNSYKMLSVKKACQADTTASCCMLVAGYTPLLMYTFSQLFVSLLFKCKTV